MRAILLSKKGSDRATAYGMSGKIVSRQGQYLLCSWLDVARRNQWALVDAKRGEVVRRGTVGPSRRDNHCGVALCAAPDGMTHCIIGAHGGSFMHYRMPAGEDRAKWHLMEDAIGRGATYPSLVCDAEGTLHLTYRFSGRTPYLVMYARRRKEDASWSDSRPLVRAAVPVHTWTTHAIEVGPEGRLHVVITNTRTLPDGAWYYGASHIYSDDSGESWRQLGDGSSLTLPAVVDTLKRIEGEEFHADRTQAREDQQRQRVSGPGNYYYHNILLSNPVIDEAGRPWVVVHNLLRGEAALYHADESTWTGVPLGNVVRAVLPDHQISHMGQLSRHDDGTLEVVLTVVPDEIESYRYGVTGTKLARILVDAAGTARTRELVCQPDPDGIPDWQPSIQRATQHARTIRPALLYTRGINSHTLTDRHTNVNAVETEVWLQIPQ